MTPRHLHRALALGATLLSSVLALTEAPAVAATSLSVQPSRVIHTASVGLLAIANDGTIYSGYGPIDVWTPSSDGAPTIAKSFTGMSIAGQPSLLPGVGLAWADNSALAVQVMNPSQAAGPYVATRTISGPATLIDNPVQAAFAPDGSIWVADAIAVGNPGYEFLRFAPGASGDVAPVQRISGRRTGFGYPGQSGFGVPIIAGLPGHGLVAAHTGVRIGFSVFSGSQQGDVAPVHRVTVASPSPGYLTEGVTADAAGRVYLGAGDTTDQGFGFLDVFSSAGRRLLTLGGPGQDFRIPLGPSVSPNGTLAVIDAAIIDLGSGSPTVDGQVDVFKPLFTRPGAVRSLAVRKTASKLIVSWKPPTNPSGTPLTYTVTVKKGPKTLLTKRTGATSLGIARSGLPTGSLKVSVTATNVGGSGPAAGRSFTD